MGTDARSPLRRFLGYVRPYHRLIALATVCGMAKFILPSTMALTLKFITDRDDQHLDGPGHLRLLPLRALRDGRAPGRGRDARLASTRASTTCSSAARRTRYFPAIPANSAKKSIAFMVLMTTAGSQMPFIPERCSAGMGHSPRAVGAPFHCT
jgi:hypothetical protein